MLMFKNLSPLFLLLIVISSGIGDTEGTVRGFGLRNLLSFIESPRGTNATFECSPSGACVACLYSEKNDEKYRCSETGYRIPLKCVEIKDSSKVSNLKRSQKTRSTLETTHNNAELCDAKKLTTSVAHRNLLDDSSSSEGSSQSYITYRSCIPPVNEEKLSVLGFEVIVLGFLLVSGSVVYMRRKQTVSTAGFASGRIQTNSRFQLTSLWVFPFNYC